MCVEKDIFGIGPYIKKFQPVYDTFTTSNKMEDVENIDWDLPLETSAGLPARRVAVLDRPGTAFTNLVVFTTTENMGRGTEEDSARFNEKGYRTSVLAGGDPLIRNVRLPVWAATIEYKQRGGKGLPDYAVFARRCQRPEFDELLKEYLAAFSSQTVTSVVSLVRRDLKKD